MAFRGELGFLMLQVCDGKCFGRNLQLLVDGLDFGREFVDIHTKLAELIRDSELQRNNKNKSERERSAIDEYHVLACIVVVSEPTVKMVELDSQSLAASAEVLGP